MRFKVLVMTIEFVQIAYWCDDEWCFWKDLEEKLQSKSDDFVVTFLPDSFTDSDIDNYVRNKNHSDSFVLRLSNDVNVQHVKSLIDKYSLSVK